MIRVALVLSALSLTFLSAAASAQDLEVGVFAGYARDFTIADANRDTTVSQQFSGHLTLYSVRGRALTFGTLIGAGYTELYWDALTYQTFVSTTLMFGGSYAPVPLRIKRAWLGPVLSLHVGALLGFGDFQGVAAGAVGAAGIMFELPKGVSADARRARIYVQATYDQWAFTNVRTTDEKLRMGGLGARVGLNWTLGSD